MRKLLLLLLLLIANCIAYYQVGKNWQVIQKQKAMRLDPFGDATGIDPFTPNNEKGE